jgi:tetratricopeptide (TPR) repeat protein
MTVRCEAGRGIRALGLLAAAVSLAWIIAQTICPAADNAPQSPTPAEITRAIDQLADPAYVVRQRASQWLWKTGKPALPSLEKAHAESTDTEVVYRCDRLLDAIRWGITPDTPLQTIQLIYRFRHGTYDIRRQVCQRLAAEKNEILLQILIERESDPVRQKLLAQNYLPQAASPSHEASPAVSPPVSPPSAPLPYRKIRESVCSLLVQGDFEAAEKILQDQAGDDAIRDYVALLLSRSRADIKIAQFQQQLKTRADATTQLRLAYLFRAKGDLPNALAAARNAARRPLEEDILIEQGDWTQLTKLGADLNLDHALRANSRDLATVARRAMFQRLAGQKEDSGRTLDALSKFGRENKYVHFASHVLLLNDRFEQGIDLYHQHGKQDPSVFIWLTQQGRYREAFRRLGLADLSTPKPDWLTVFDLASANDLPARKRFQLACQVARTLDILGEKSSARDLASALESVTAKKGGDIEFQKHLIPTLLALTLPERAAEQVAMFTEKDPRDFLERLQYLTGEQSSLGPAFWHAMRAENPNEPVATTLVRLHRLLAQQASQRSSLEIFRKLAPQVERNLSLSDHYLHARTFTALACYFDRWGDRPLALAYADKATAETLTPEQRVNLGAVFCNAQLWSRAAAVYDIGWTNDHANIDLLYLLGRANLQAGKPYVAQKQMELARMLPLANARIRHDLAKTLRAQHLDDEAMAQSRFALRLSEVGWYSYIANSCSYLGTACHKQGEYLAAAAFWERGATFWHYPTTIVRFTHAYIHEPTIIHLARGRGLLKSGKVPECLEELRQAQSYEPANIQIPLDAVPELEKAGRKTDADALFARTFSFLEQLCLDFPRSDHLHNQIAWMSANLNRELDKAAQHATQAAQLAPNNPACLDTLAEVQFRKRNPAEAIRHARRCLELDPDNEHYREQLARFQSAALTNPRLPGIVPSDESP